MTDMKTKSDQFLTEEELNSFSVIDYSECSEPSVIKSIYSPTLYPRLKITTNNVTREIEVVFVSVQNEDKQLLHKLLTKTRAAEKA